jgi:hypothetical protein
MLIIMREREGHAGRGLFGPTVWVTMCKARGQYRVKKLKATWAYCGTKEETGVGMDAQSSKGCKVVGFYGKSYQTVHNKITFTHPSLRWDQKRIRFVKQLFSNSICESIIFFREVVFFQEKLFFGAGAGAPRSSTKSDLFFMYI